MNGRGLGGAPCRLSSWTVWLCSLGSCLSKRAMWASSPLCLQEAPQLEPAWPLISDPYDLCSVITLKNHLGPGDTALVPSPTMD